MSTQKSSVPDTGVPPQIQRLHSMIGEWDVQFESRASPDEPFVLQQITSHVIPILGGAFLQEGLSIPTSSGHGSN